MIDGSQVAQYGLLVGDDVVLTSTNIVELAVTSVYIAG